MTSYPIPTPGAGSPGGAKDDKRAADHAASGMNDAQPNVRDATGNL